MYRFVCSTALSFSMLLVAGCGNQGVSTSPAAPTPSTPSRGTLLQSPPVRLASYAPAEILALLGGSDLGKLLLQTAYTPRCNIDIHQITYETVDPSGALTPGSGALMVPSGTDPACSGSRPILMYAHGTSTDRQFNIADISDASNSEGVLLAAVFAAQGYIVVAPNYIGYDSSTLSYHPYLVADQQSKDMIDALTSARSALPTTTAPSTTASAKLFLTGYSQGGYVAMATHRAMQDAGMTVTASAPMSGPYALSAFGDAIFAGQVSASAPVNMTLLITAYQRAYGNLYTQPGECFARVGVAHPGQADGKRHFQQHTAGRIRIGHHSGNAARSASTGVCSGFRCRLPGYQ
jgi:poly(3-hydroxybutyrate) depolymerase